MGEGGIWNRLIHFLSQASAPNSLTVSSLSLRAVILVLGGRTILWGQKGQHQQEGWGGGGCKAGRSAGSNRILGFWGAGGGV